MGERTDTCLKPEGRWQFDGGVTEGFYQTIGETVRNWGEDEKINVPQSGTAKRSRTECG